MADKGVRKRLIWWRVRRDPESPYRTKAPMPQSLKRKRDRKRERFFFLQKGERTSWSGREKKKKENRWSE